MESAVAVGALDRAPFDGSLLDALAAATSEMDRALDRAEERHPVWPLRRTDIRKVLGALVGEESGTLEFLRLGLGHQRDTNTIRPQTLAAPNLRLTPVGHLDGHHLAVGTDKPKLAAEAGEEVSRHGRRGKAKGPPRRAERSRAAQGAERRGGAGSPERDAQRSRAAASRMPIQPGQPSGPEECQPPRGGTRPGGVASDGAASTGSLA